MLACCSPVAVKRSASPISIFSTLPLFVCVSFAHARALAGGGCIVMKLGRPLTAMRYHGSSRYVARHENWSRSQLVPFFPSRKKAGASYGGMARTVILSGESSWLKLSLSRFAPSEYKIDK